MEGKRKLHEIFLRDIYSKVIIEEYISCNKEDIVLLNCIDFFFAFCIHISIGQNVFFYNFIHI